MAGRLVTAVLALLAAVLAPAGAAAKEYLLTGAKPNRLVLVDPAARQAARVYEIPNAAPGPSTIVPSPDGKVAYAIVNRWESISGIDLDTGREVFRADLSEPGLRVKAMFGMDVTPDGKELYVLLSPVRIGRENYEVQETRIAVFRTADGVGAKAVRTFPAPRRVAVLAFSKDGSRLYAAGWDLYVFDPRSGRIVDTHKVRNWGRSNYAEPDVLDVWPQFEQAGVFSTPYFVVRTDVDPSKPEAFKTGLLTLDLATGQFEMKDFENTEVIIFSSVVNPVRRNEVYGVYTTLTKVDRDTSSVVKRIELDHTYYDVNVSGDGKELYVGGTMSDIGVYATDTLARIGTIQIPGGADQGISSLRVIRR